MSKYVKIGGHFEIQDHPEFQGEEHNARVFGDVLEIPDDVAQRAILEGAALLPADAFEAIGFTEEEIAKYPNANQQAEAPPEWKQKHFEALVGLHHYRVSLLKAKEESNDDAAV